MERKLTREQLDAGKRNKKRPLPNYNFDNDFDDFLKD